MEDNNNNHIASIDLFYKFCISDIVSKNAANFSQNAVK